MESLPSGAPPAGFFLSVLTESFAVRAFLGSLVALALAAVAMRRRWVHAPRARRLAVLAPIVTAGVAAVASVVEAEVYLPQLWIASAAATPGPVVELLGELRFLSTDGGLDVLLVGWLLVVTVLTVRRLWGAVATRRLLAVADDIPSHHPAAVMVSRLSAAMRAGHVTAKLLPDCPGGALTAGTRHPVVVIDPAVLSRLDDKEAEGLLAHEIAHVARRDTLLGIAVGIVSDVTFFLPTVHVVRRWLRREREESADELASAHTRRPAALASSILKVWEGASSRPQPMNACAAVADAATLPGRMLTRPTGGLSDGARVVASRVERLVAGVSPRSAARQAAEVTLAAAVIVAASVATVAVPQWIARDLHTSAVAIGYVPPPAHPVESPAFSTFRALAPVVGADAQLHGYERTYAPRPSVQPEHVAGCPCVESQAQWLAGVPAAAPRVSEGMAWRRTSSPSWDTRPTPGSVEARPLLTLPEARPRVGFFVVAEAQGG